MKDLQMLDGRWGGRSDAKDIARFWTKVDKSGECWIWTAARFPSGYGIFWWNGDTGRAHRFAWTIDNGPIPNGLLVCHRCDTPACVRPDHLFLGTNADNSADRDAKGRHRTGDVFPDRRGEKNKSAKLTTAQVLEIKSALASGDESQASIGRRYGVCQVTISQIKLGDNWAHI